MLRICARARAWDSPIRPPLRLVVGNLGIELDFSACLREPLRTPPYAGQILALPLARGREAGREEGQGR